MPDIDSRTVNLLNATASDTVISLPFNFSDSGGVAATTNQAKIWADRVFAVLGTRPGERVMDLKYGSLVQNYAFETLETATIDISNEIRAAFSRFLIELTLNDVTVFTDYSDSGDPVLSASLDYTLPNKQTDSIQVRLGSFTRSGELIRETT